MDNSRKLAFIHIMRTGGAYAVNQIAAAGVTLHCPWHLSLNRDWTRAELFSLARRQEGLVHSHVISWDDELVDWYNAHGWRTFTIVRDPCEQLTSVWHFCGCPGELNDFVRRQLAGDEVCLDFHHWAIPDYFHKLRRIVAHGELLRQSILSALDLPSETGAVPPENGRTRIASLSEDTRSSIRASAFFSRYVTALASADTQDNRGA